ncbi:aldehyde dehydrogenase [Apiospora aurea]|uniref:aldehyde dehydrogenase (NAD(+)) n=1 Tax=Apiospora aurea TaxID=335848 RepID=A0ABR1QP36_9PEZI
MAATLDTTHFPGNVINNEFVPTVTTRHSIDPSTGEPLWEVPVATKDDLDNAVKYAREAFKTWSTTTFQQRAEMLLRYADAIEANREPLEKLHTMEQGKPLSLSKTEFDLTLTWLRAFATMEIRDEVLEDTEERTIYATFPPLGVCAGIVPWNWPILLGLGKMGPALVTGNCFIMKPSPYTPYCDLKLGELAMAMFPPGVVQVVSGDDELGPWMTEHPGIDMIAFTGSIPTGKRVAASCARTLKRCVLELGGNDACIVCDDVDLARCVPKIATLSFLNTGQICMLPKRIYVHERIYDAFRDAMVQFTRENIRTGGGFEEGVVVGPVQNRMQHLRRRPPHRPKNRPRRRRRLPQRLPHHPLHRRQPPDTSRIVTEEPFGPIVPLLKWRDEGEVLARANDSATGLGASVWSRDVARAERMARRLSAGSVWVNSHFDVAPHVPFGGHKESGIGMEWGVMGLKSYTKPRSLWVWKKVFEDAPAST